MVIRSFDAKHGISWTKACSDGNASDPPVAKIAQKWAFFYAHIFHINPVFLFRYVLSSKKKETT